MTDIYKYTNNERKWIKTSPKLMQGISECSIIINEQNELIVIGGCNTDWNTYCQHIYTLDLQSKIVTESTILHQTWSDLRSQSYYKLINTKNKKSSSKCKKHCMNL